MLHNKLHYNTEGAVCGLYTFSQMNFVPETEDICMVIIHDLTNDREIEAQEEQTLASVCPSVSGETAWPVAGAYYHDEFVGLQEKVGAGGAVRWVPGGGGCFSGCLNGGRVVGHQCPSCGF